MYTYYFTTTKKKALGICFMTLKGHLPIAKRSSEIQDFINFTN